MALTDFVNLFITMSKNSIGVISWRNRTKDRIVQSFGKSCGVCGYSKCNSSFDLHHLDPTKKDFAIGKIRANPISWEKIVDELRKCVMLCANCHREYHDGMFEIPTEIKRFDERFSDYKRTQQEDRNARLYNECFCGKEKFHTQKTCSYECAAKLKGTVKWDRFDLVDLYIVQKKNLSQIGKIVGCSSNGVKKRLTKMKII